MSVSNSMGTKKVEELLANKSMPQGMQFFVPNYQRGYRWKESQVQQLLNDLSEFDYEKGNESRFYCLQPLVVKEDKEKGWIVIDGQQRLTTLFIILTCIEKMLYKEKAKLFVMNYQNKTQMHDWLESLGIVKLDPNSGEVIDEVALNEEDIDAYHITNAYLTVKKWLENTYDYKAIGAEIREKIRTYTRFIWYEINGDVKPEIIFTNINMGKIKLTNAELIKALLLKKDNYKGESEKEITASQIKISTAWDNMEATLQREDMWRFLTGSGKFSSIDTHMELIFQIMANEIIKSRVEKYPEFYIENEKQLNMETYTFIIFNREIEYMKREYVDVGDYKYSKMLEDFWGKVESFYNMFIDWYEDREWYHLIGVLLSKDENQSEEYFENLCNLYRGHTKTEFVMELKKKIISEIEFEDTDKDDFEFGEEVVREYLNSLQYSGKKAEKDKIKNMLLLISKGTPVGNFANIVHVAIEDVKVVGKMVSGELSMREGIDKLEQTTVSTVAGIASTGKGTAVGGFVGGAVGYMAGSKVGETIVKGAQKIRDGARKVISKIGEKVADVVSSIGNGISNAISGVLVFLGI